MPISGHSVFSRDAVRDSGWSAMKGGLTGTAYVSIEALDAKVDTMVDAPDWLADYNIMRQRRQYYYDIEGE